MKILKEKKTLVLCLNLKPQVHVKDCVCPFKSGLYRVTWQRGGGGKRGGGLKSQECDIKYSMK